MNKRDQQQTLSTIQEISRKLDIPKSTLRYWEKEFDGLFAPIRTNGGQRRYSAEHITIINEIKRCRIRGMSLENIKMKLIRNHKDKEIKPGLEGIDNLADRVAEVVKNEVYSFLRREENGQG